MIIPPRLQFNEFGFYEVIDKPSEEELSQYYAQRYFQQNQSSYQAAYSAAELEHIQGKLALRYWQLTQFASVTGSPLFLDIGCGEGWALDYFHKQGWQVLGLDYSQFSLERFHPQLLNHLLTGDLYQHLDELQAQGRQFTALWLDNVLEHVTDPDRLLTQCRALVAPGGVLVVEVPNDFSTLQQHLLETGKIDRLFWVALPDHLSYFNRAGLENLSRATGWHTATVLGDHPIDLNLLHPATNYVRDRTLGPSCHQTRLEMDNLLMRTAPVAAVAEYYRGLAQVGLGRNLVAFLQPVTGPV